METLKRILDKSKSKFSSYAEFEKALGIKPKTVDSWKRGKSKTYYKMMPKISKVLECSPEYLLGTEATSLPDNDDNIKFALFGGTDGITDEMYDEVKQFAEMVKLREKAKKKGLQ